MQPTPTPAEETRSDNGQALKSSQNDQSQKGIAAGESGKGLNKAEQEEAVTSVNYDRLKENPFIEKVYACEVRWEGRKLIYHIDLVTNEGIERVSLKVTDDYGENVRGGTKPIKEQDRINDPGHYSASGEIEMANADPDKFMILLEFQMKNGANKPAFILKPEP